MRVLSMNEWFGKRKITTQLRVEGGGELLLFFVIMLNFVSKSQKCTGTCLLFR